MLTDLNPQKQNAAAFHTLTVLFWAAHFKPSTPPIILPPLLAALLIAVDD